MPGHRHAARGVVERLAEGVLQILAHALDAETSGARYGYLQSLDPRAKLVGLVALLLAAVFTTRLLGLVPLFLVALALASASQVAFGRLRQVWFSVLLFTGTIALPALVVVPGEVLWTLPILHWDITRQGLHAAAMLIGRAETSATLAVLLVLTTPWPHLLKAMRALGVPVVVVAILGMTHRYIFVFLQATTQLFEARRSRIVARATPAEARRMAISSLAVLLGKAFQLASEVHLAMVSRGYRGEVHLLHEFRMTSRDYLFFLAAFALPCLILWTLR